MSAGEGQDERLLDINTENEEKKTVTVYTLRWYILAVFSLIAGTQGAVWNTWGPIADSAEKNLEKLPTVMPGRDLMSYIIQAKYAGTTSQINAAGKSNILCNPTPVSACGLDCLIITLGWNDGTIALMTNWGPISYIFATPVFTWLMDVKGLRLVTVLSMFLVTVGSGLRCIPASNTVRTVLIHIGQLLNGIPGPLCMAAPPLLSAIWFPVSQRTTATAIGTVFAGIGVTSPFILGPLIVQDLSNKTSNGSSSLEMLTIDADHFENFAQNHTGSDIEKMLQEINIYMYGTLAWCVLLLLLVVIYFPSKPPSPPSVTASIQRLDYISGLKSLFRNKKFWTLGAVYGISLGIYNCFVSVLEVLLKEKNISQEDAGWLGFYCGIAGNIAALVVAGFADVFKRRMKLYIVVLYIGAALAFGICAVSYSGWLIPFTKATAYSTQLVGALCLTAVTPLFYELSCEASYPVAEGITNGLLTWLNNFSGLIFLLVLMNPSPDKSWMLWTLLGGTVISIPFLLLMRARFGRLDVDIPERIVNICEDDEPLITS